MHYVTSIEGNLDPGLVTLSGDSFPMNGWQITVTGTRFQARPPAESRWSGEDAQRELVRVMGPVLTVLGPESGMKVTMRVSSVQYADSENANANAHSEGLCMAEVGGLVAIEMGVEQTAQFVRKAAWVEKDPLYRDLLDRLTEAVGAANPRPAAFKLIERLEMIENARERLGLTKAPFDTIGRDQSRYEGDRHAQYEIGHRPPPIGPTEREAVLAAARLIIERYEATILMRNGGC